MKGINETLPHFITVEADNTTLKTSMTIDIEKNNVEFNFKNISSFHKLLGFYPPRKIY